MIAWRALLAGLLLFAAGAAGAQPLPAEVDAALARARLPPDAMTVIVAPADGRSPARVAHRPDAPVNPASIAKLTTTFAALDLLGPAFSWTTGVYADGPVQDGVLQGNLYVRGQGDPKLVVERLWLLLRRVQGLGIRAIAGDIVLDRSAFELPAVNPAAFDGEPLRPYNAAPDALLLNFRSVVLTFTPQGSVARVQSEPPLAGVSIPATVALLPGDCGDWRGALRADFADASRLAFAGGYPASCGERTWPVAYWGDAAGYAGRAVAGLWAQMGGLLRGQAREGRVPPGLAPLADIASPPLADIVRDINKYSNNVMAQQVFLTLGLQRGEPSTFPAARETVRQWWAARIGGEPPLLDNGSGLSRDERTTARQLTRLLQVAWASPVMSELMSSLPVAGIDGTLKRSRGPAGRAHLKTGSLRDVAGVAGYVDGASGRRWVLVAIVNHPQAAQARPALDALVDWTARDTP